MTEPPVRHRVADQSLGRAANRFVSFSVVAAIVGFVLMLVFFFAFFLPMWRENNQRFDDIRRDLDEPRHSPTFPGR